MADRLKWLALAVLLVPASVDAQVGLQTWCYSDSPLCFSATAFSSSEVFVPETTQFQDGQYLTSPAYTYYTYALDGYWSGAPANFQLVWFAGFTGLMDCSSLGSVGVNEVGTSQCSRFSQPTPIELASLDYLSVEYYGDDGYVEAVTCSGDCLRRAAVPEPSTALLLLVGLVGMLSESRRRSRRWGD